MPRTANIEIFKSTINTGTTYFSSMSTYEALGRADHIALEVIIDGVNTAATTVTVTWQYSNDPSTDATWTDSTSLVSKTVSTAALTDPPKAGMFSTGTDVMGAYGRAKITTSQDGTTVRLIACLRSDG